MKKFFKLFSARVFFALILLAGLCLLAKVCLAAQLEVQYPEIAGKTLTADTKLPDFALYLFNAGVFIGFFTVFISLIIAGVMYFLSPAKPDFLANAKDRVSGAISGLLILVLTYLIITTINPQLSIFRLNEPAQAPPPAIETKAPGVYFYPQSDCSNDRIQPKTSSISDLGELKNHVNSVGIVQGDSSYISILYDNINFWGKCQYINPNSACTKVDNFAASASVHTYDFKPNDDGVYFYRKSCLPNQAINSPSQIVSYCNENSGGYYKVKNSEINGIYVKKLEDLPFTNVPEEEQDCIKYDENGLCSERKTPNLGGENISSVVIKGNYLVLFVYFGVNDNPTGIWSFCQEFPTADDVNKLGPQQIKWQKIRNSSVENVGGVIPNYVVIIPIQT